MGIIRYQPGSIMQDMHNELSKLFDKNFPETDGSNVSTSDWLPAVDIKEERDRFVLLADIPGVEPKDIEVHMDNGILTIQGERSHQSNEEHEGYKRIERSHGSFYRRFNLPDTADSDGIKAKGKHGVLEVTIPKIERNKARRIEVNESE